MGMYGGGRPSKNPIGKNNVKSPLAPQPVPQKLDSMPPSRGAHSPRIYIRSSPNIESSSRYVCAHTRACAFGKWWGAPFENALRYGAKNPSNEIMCPLKHPKRHRLGCYRKILQGGHLLKAHWGSKIRIWKYIRSSPNFRINAPTSKAMCFGKWWGNRKCIPKNPSEMPLTNLRVPRKVNFRRSHSPGANMHLIIPKFLKPALRACAFGKWGGPLLLGCQKSNHFQGAGFLQTRFPTFQRSFLRICIWSFPTLLWV